MFASSMRCPICKTEHTPSAATVKLGPFCSPRCQLIDLGQWLSEDYRIPDSSALSEEDIEAVARAAEASEADAPRSSSPRR